MKAVAHQQVAKIPTPDHFAQPGDHSRLREIRKTYKDTLGRFMLISVFSHFEAYVQDVVNEMLKFHGGSDVFIKIARSRAAAIDPSKRLVDFPQIKSLSEYPKSGKTGKYRKAVSSLENRNFIFPSQMTSPYGIRKLTEAVSRSGFKAHRISEIVFDALGLPHDSMMEDNINRIREIRNDIAHGRRREYHLTKSIEDVKLLRKYALKIDQHILFHFLIIE
jgi:RiboL-PSP-HEPN